MLLEKNTYRERFLILGSNRKTMFNFLISWFKKWDQIYHLTSVFLSDSFSLVFRRPFWLSLYLGFERLYFWRLCPARQHAWGRKLSLLCHLFFDLFQWQSIFLSSWIVVCTHLCVYVFNFMDVFSTLLCGHFLYICIYLRHLLISSAEVIVILSLLSYLEFSVVPHPRSLSTIT